jgi:hypothetical protein
MKYEQDPIEKVRVSLVARMMDDDNGSLPPSLDAALGDDPSYIV